MKYLYPIVLLLCSINPILSQELELCRQVIGVTGSSAISSGQNFAYTIGEPVIGTVSSQDYILTQGFHQPELCIVLDVTTFELEDTWSLKLFPNPTSDQIQLTWEGQGIVPLHHYVIYNAQGQQVIISSKEIDTNTSSINCQQLAAGSYYLQVFLSEKNQKISLPFIVSYQ